MLQTLLTTMLFILPFLVSKAPNSRPALHTGLWISLFFWGRIHAAFSLLVFGICLFIYIFAKGQQSTPFPSDPPFIQKPGSKSLTVSFAILIVFCAFGNVCEDYGESLSLPPVFLKSALTLGFLGSLLGPLFFGWLCDKAGVFPSFMVLVFVGFAALCLAAASAYLPSFFPFAPLLIQAVISGTFLLMPFMLLQFYGRNQLTHVIPFLLFFLITVWSIAQSFYNRTSPDTTPPEDYLLSMMFLLLGALPLARKAWRNRLAVL